MYVLQVLQVRIRTVEPSLVDTNGTYHCVQYTVEPSLVDTNGTYHCVQYTVEPSLVDTNGTYHCVQYTVEPSLVDTNGTYHSVRYSEVSFPQGLLRLVPIGTVESVLYIVDLLNSGCP